VALNNQGAIFYNVKHKEDTLINPSSLGFVLQQNDSLMHFTLKDTSTRTFNETWKPVWGTTSKIKNHYNEFRLTLSVNETNRLLQIYFRCYNDGFAFRYEIWNSAEPEEIIITSEESKICLAGLYQAWWCMADYNTYEKPYVHSITDSAKHVATPFTLKKENGPYLCIHEAAIENYSSITLLQKQAHPLTYKINLVPWADGSKVKTQTPAKTPWRVFIISETPEGLLESNLIYNLNEPCTITDVSWIKPLTYVGIWWGMHLGLYTWHEGERHGATTERAKQYIDFAAENKLGGFLAEGWNTGWEHWGKPNAFDFITPYNDFNLKEICQYAHSKGIQIIGHHETGGDIPSYEAAIDSAFALYRSLGIHAVKTGYAGNIIPEGEYHHGQYMINHYNMVMKKAADYQLMLDVHEPIMLSGLSRTYPNLMAAEGARGMEWNAWSEGNKPSHTCTLPFTRLMAGPMDYTPGIFDIDLSNFANERNKWNAQDIGNTTVHSTIANQLALMIVLYSPLQMAADLPESYFQQPAFQFMKNLPSTWDESIVIDAEIGEFVVICRRKGETWYLGAITNENKKTIQVNLSFLNPEKQYTATCYFDASDAHYEKNPETIDISEIETSYNQIITINMSPGGGATMIIEPIP
jgi:alpha-glucosidase